MAFRVKRSPGEEYDSNDPDLPRKLMEETTDGMDIRQESEFHPLFEN